MKVVLFAKNDFTISEKVAMAKYLGLNPYIYVYINNGRIRKVKEVSSHKHAIILLEDKGEVYDIIFDEINSESEILNTYFSRFEDDIALLRFDQAFISHIEKNPDIFKNLFIQELQENKPFMIHELNPWQKEEILYFDEVDWMEMENNQIKFR